MYMQPINYLIPLKRALGKGNKTRNRPKMTRFPYILQDYDLKKLDLNEWVAVAYKEGFYIGKVEKILAHKVRINFLSEDDHGAFIWPRVSDKQDIKAIFIFRCNVEVTQAHEGATKFNVKNIKLIKDRFKAFSLKYF